MVKPFLQIQICTLGQDGVKKTASHKHPVIDGVRWLLSIQSHDNVTIPESLLSRCDFDFIINDDKGLARNRNNALSFPSECPYVLLADDDVDYNEEGIKKLIEAFRENESLDIICCRFTTKGKYVKFYGNAPFTLSKPPKGWYVSSIEIAFRRKKGERIKFNEKLGIGAEKLIAGEEAVWLYDMLKSGATGKFFPIDIGEHDELSTSIKTECTPLLHQTLGAVLFHIKPISWMPRLVLYAHRSSTPFFKCFIQCLKGVQYAVTKQIYTSKTSRPVDKR